MQNENSKKSKSDDEKDSSGVATRETTEPKSSGKKKRVTGLKTGQIVYFKPSKNDNTVNGNTEEKAPAIITKVWDENTVNVTVFRDGPPIAKSAVIKEGEPGSGNENGSWSEDDE